MLLRAAIACGLAAVLSATGAGVAAAADPAGFRGTLSITHDFHPGRASASLTSSNVAGGFQATYRLRGRRWRSRFARPRSYLLTGRGHERLGLSRDDFKQDESGSASLTFGAQAEGDVRLLARPDGPRETSGLILRLRPRGRFTLELGPLRGHGDGLPLEFGLGRDDQQHCVVGPGTRRARQTYHRGVFEIRELQHCPDEEAADPVRIGTDRAPTIWGGNVWAPPEAGFWQPNVCRGRVAALPVLRVCGRVREDRMRGTVRIGGDNVIDGSRLGYPTPGICALFPRGPGGRELPPPTDGLYEACSRMDLGADWNRSTVVRWSFRPID